VAAPTRDGAAPGREGAAPRGRAGAGAPAVGGGAGRAGGPATRAPGSEPCREVYPLAAPATWRPGAARRRHWTTPDPRIIDLLFCRRVATATRSAWSGAARGPRLRVSPRRGAADAHTAQSQRRRPANRRPGAVDGVLRGARLGAVGGLHPGHVPVQDDGQPAVAGHRRPARRARRRRGGRRAAGEPNREAVLSIHVATDGEVAAAVEEAARAGGVVVKRPTATPLGGSYAFFADPDGHLWEVIRHPLYRLGADGRPELP
jgi:catechol 2,3-dioxygenase-like lactoylglutathione lyase family enzyme